MSVLVGDPEDRFSRVAAQLSPYTSLIIANVFSIQEVVCIALFCFAVCYDFHYAF